MSLFLYRNPMERRWMEDEMEHEMEQAINSLIEEVTPWRRVPLGHLMYMQERPPCSSCQRPYDRETKKVPQKEAGASGTDRTVAEQNSTQRKNEHLLERLMDLRHPFRRFEMVPTGEHFAGGKDHPFDIRVNIGDCDPDQVKVEAKDGVLKVEGRKEKDGSLSYVRYERSIPEGVSPSSLKASLLSKGILKIQEERKPKHVFPIAVEVEKGQDAQEKAQAEKPKTAQKS